MTDRLKAMLALDIKLAWRHGFLPGSLFLLVCFLFRLRSLPDSSLYTVLPIVLMLNLFFHCFYVAAALVVREKYEGSFSVISVTPLRPHEYLASKSLTLAGIASAENVFIAVLARAGFHPLPLLLGSLAAGGLFVLFAMQLAAWFHAPIRFHAALLACIVILVPALLPMPIRGIAVHPLRAPLVLLLAAFQPASARLWAYGLGYSALWAGFAFFGCKRAFARLRAL